MLADTAGVEVVGEAGRVGDARRLILELRPDVAVLDARLPDGSGIDVCRDVRSADPDIHALILTSHDDDKALFSAIMAGASGYLLKDVLGTDLVDAIQRVAAGHSLLDPTVTGLVLDRIRRGDEGPPELRGLSPREREILVLIAEGFTNREISRRLTLTEPTVKTYVSRLFAKLDIERRTQAAVLATKLLKKR
jgi:DNA-binding NarL/FixJ family response regulator